jgi:hypothetical protein
VRLLNTVYLFVEKAGADVPALLAGPGGSDLWLPTVEYRAFEEGYVYPRGAPFSRLLPDCRRACRGLRPCRHTGRHWLGAVTTVDGRFEGYRVYVVTRGGIATVRIAPPRTPYRTLFTDLEVVPEPALRATLLLGLGLPAYG